MEKRREVQVGLLFILAVTVLIMGVLWFKEFRIGGQVYTIRVEFVNTSGLQKGDPVEVRGVTSGSVADITYEAGRAIVSLQLDNSVEIWPDTQFVIENVGIMGQKLVAIYPGSPGEPLPSDMIFEGTFQPGIPALMADLGGALDSFERLAVRLEALLEAFDETEQGRMNRILANTEQLTKDLAEFLRSTRGDLAETVGNFNDAMRNLNSVLEGRSEDFAEALEHATAATARLDSTLVTMNRAMERADSLLAGVEAGEGTLGKLAQDERLYEELRGALSEAQALITDMKENPRKYLKFSVF